MKVYGIFNCTTFKRAVKWFEEHHIEIEKIDYRANPLTIEEIEQYHKKSKQDIKKFFNTSGGLYRELGLKDKYKEMSLKEIYQLLSENPMLIKRPLVVDKDYVRTGFKESEYIEKWLNN